MSVASPPASESLRVARMLSSAGVNFWWGCWVIGPEDAVLAIDDPIALEAKVRGMTKEEVEGFNGHDWRCRATTSRGKRCSNWVAAMGRENAGSTSMFAIDPDNPRLFFCLTHIHLQPKGGQR